MNRIWDETSVVTAIEMIGNQRNNLWKEENICYNLKNNFEKDLPLYFETIIVVALYYVYLDLTTVCK